MLILALYPNLLNVSFMKKFENIKLLEFLVIFELIFENVNIGLNLGMTKRTFKMRFFKSSDALDALVLS